MVFYVNIVVGSSFTDFVQTSQTHEISPSAPHLQSLSEVQNTRLGKHGRKLLTTDLQFSAAHKLLPSDSQSGQSFGRSVDIDEDTVAISTGMNSVYIFTRDEPGVHSSPWTQRAKLTSPHCGNSCSFGQSLSISGDTLAITEYYYGSGSYYYDYSDPCYTYNSYGQQLSNTGQVLIFTRDQPGLLASGWTHRRNVTSPNCRQVCMYENSCAHYNFGYGYNCYCNQVNCTRTRIDCSQAQYESFGQKVLLDGDSLFVGTNNEAFVFTRDEPGSLTSAWSNRSSITLTGYNYGWSTDDGTLAILTTSQGQGYNNGPGYYYSPSPYSTTTQVHVYSRDNVADLHSAWTLRANFTSRDLEQQATSCNSIDLDTDIVVIGCPHFDASTGAAFVFTRESSIWSERARLTGDKSVQNSNFGQSVSCSGGVIMIGAPNDDEMGIDSGSLYTYIFDDVVQDWIMTAKLNPADARVQDNFGGTVVSQNGNEIMVSSQNDDDNGPNSGSVYVLVTALPPSPPPPSQSNVGVVYLITGYSVETFGMVEQTKFCRTIASLLKRDENSVEIINITTVDSRRRRLVQVVELKIRVKFVVHVLNEAISKVVGTQLDLFAVVDKETLLFEFKRHGLDNVGDVILIEDSEYESRLAGSGPSKASDTSEALNSNASFGPSDEEDGVPDRSGILFLTIVAIARLFV